MPELVCSADDPRWQEEPAWLVQFRALMAVHARDHGLRGDCQACESVTLVKEAVLDILDLFDLTDGDASPGAVAAVRARVAPLAGKSAEVDPGLWETWQSFKVLADQGAEVLKLTEESIRDQAGDAKVLTVNGAKVAVRVVRKVENASWTADYFRRVTR